MPSLTELYNQHFGTLFTSLVTMVIVWGAGQASKVFKKINDTTETKAKLDALYTRFEKHLSEHDEDVKYLQKQINELS